MVKALQKKFIFTAMTAVSILLIVLIGGINIADCLIYARQTNEQLEMLIHTEKRMIKQERSSFEQERFLLPPTENKKDMEKRNIFNPPMDEDTAMSLRFFVLRLDEKDHIIHQDISRISSVSDEEAETYAKQALQKNKTNGYMNHFKYKMVDYYKTEHTESDIEKIIVFLEVSGQLRALLIVFVVSVSIAAICWLVMLVLVIGLSRRAIRPIAQNIQKQKQFVTDAGHEIKTPLAIIQANVDAMELINGENKWSRNIKSQTLRLSGLMQYLLTLAKMDEGNQELKMEDLSMDVLLQESLQPFYEAAELRGIIIETDIQSEITVFANREYMQRLFSILMDNAVKYTNSSGKIMVSLFQSNKTDKTDKIDKTNKTNKTDKKTVLRVTNTCDELPFVDAEKLFDRFYRADSARTQKSGGYGIGLSAASAMVAAQKGTISAETIDEKTISFVVKI